MTTETVRWSTAVVLAAGSSRRLGQPKQLLPFRDKTLLGATLDVVRRCGFDQLLLTLGGAADEVRRRVDLTGFEVAAVTDFGTGCAASLRSALPLVRSDSAGIVLLLGDQPGLSPATVASLVADPSDAPVTVCRYRDGLGHPFRLSRSVFGDLDVMHGDKAVWKIVESGRFPVHQLDVDTTTPLDVDTWNDYERLLAESH